MKLSRAATTPADRRGKPSQINRPYAQLPDGQSLPMANRYGLNGGINKSESEADNKHKKFLCLFTCFAPKKHQPRSRVEIVALQSTKASPEARNHDDQQKTSNEGNLDIEDRKSIATAVSSSSSSEHGIDDLPKDSITHHISLSEPATQAEVLLFKRCLSHRRILDEAHKQITVCLKIIAESQKVKGA